MAMQAGTDQPVVFIQQPASAPPTQSSNPTREQQGKCRGTTLVVLGGIDVVLGVSYLIYQIARLSGTVIYSGVWGGLFIMGTGCVAIAAGRTRLRGAIIALLAMSIISIIVAGIVIPICLRVDIGLAEVNNLLGTYDVDTTTILPILSVLGFACCLTTSIISCMDLCTCCNQHPRSQTARTQMVMVSPDGKIVPVQVIDASGVQPVVPVGSDYTPLQWRNDQRDDASHSMLPPPPYSPHPEPLPNPPREAGARQSTNSGVYCEVLDVGTYLHPPALGDEGEEGYEDMTAGGQTPGEDTRTDHDGVTPHQQHPSPPSAPTALNEGPYADVK